MRRILHLSDLHFGRVNPALIDPLLKTVREVEPHVVAVSGDPLQDVHRLEAGGVVFVMKNGVIHKQP